ncbi:glycoside hydrolase family 95 protein [Pseudarthrobacter sp. DSP2-3-2b1]|uniref:glycoside hydrolase family 95 protein n=1 Tax=Pseudarthrobacter sp. DSP2-3-2b1 TaxID=2804661 RepID=UPI003CE7765E
MSTPLLGDLWFNRPASTWTEALPLGNGSLGAMVYGAVGTEHLQINDSTAWSGSPASEAVPPVISADAAAASLSSARAAVAAGDYPAADQQLRGLQHRYSQSYLPFVDFHVRTGVTGTGVPTTEGNASDYRRALNLATATHEVRYCTDDAWVTQCSYISHRHGVLVLTISTDHASGLDISTAMTSPLRILSTGTTTDTSFLNVRLPSDVEPAHDATSGPVKYSNSDDGTLRGAAVVGWTHDGIPEDHQDGLAASGVHHATIYLATQTTFVGVGRIPCGDAESARRKAMERIRTALDLGEPALRTAHVADYGALFDRVKMYTGNGPDLPLDERLYRANNHPGGVLAADPALAGLLFTFGRYLLISCSRPGGVPANLQGIWNDSLQPPWSSNYTTNINLQMNYWPAEVANLSECAAPLYDLIDALTVTGSETARRLYGAPGWVAHHNTDIWAYSQPVGLGEHDPKWAFWPMAGPWLVRHLWEHVLFGADDDFARTRAWNPIRSSAQFCLAWLQEQPDGTLGTSPSTSPENQFVSSQGIVSSVGASSTLDLILVSDVLKMVTSLAARLGVVGDDVVAAAAAAMPRIPGPVPGQMGMVPEWVADHAQAEPQHRHMSHLFFLYPGDTAVDMDLAAAAARSLDGRGDESTGWSLAWKLCLRARLGQPDKTADLIRLFFRDAGTGQGPFAGGLYANLFAAHPPFQIDGNFGYVAGVAECILQSHRGEIELLKALPPELATGSVSGLVARPGVDVSVNWTHDPDGRVHLGHATLRARHEGAAGTQLVTFRGSTIEVALPWSPNEADSAVVLLSAESFRHAGKHFGDPAVTAGI